MTIQTNSTSLSSPAGTQSASRFQRWQQQGYFFRLVAICTILFGASLHLCRLVLGDAITFAYIVTPTLDHFFIIPIAYAGITGLLSWRRMEFRNGWHKAFLGFLVFYMVVSLPFHIITYFTNSIAHISGFPRWYSVLLLPFYALALLALWTLQFKPAATDAH